MKVQESRGVLVGLILYSALFSVAKAQPSPCPLLGSARAAVLTNAFSDPILGCNITQDQATTGSSRLHWLIPEGSEVILDLESVDISGLLQDAGARPGQVAMVNRALTAGNESLAQNGLLTVGTKCVTEIEPDLVSFLLATSEDVTEFNAALGAECERRGVDMNASVRNTVIDTLLIPRLVSITVYGTISVACGVAEIVVNIVFEIVEEIVDVVSCPDTAMV